MVALVDGRVHFHSPGLFKASFSLTGKQPVEGDATEVEEENEGGTWYLLSLEWDFRVGGREGVEDLKRGSSTPNFLPSSLLFVLADFFLRHLRFSTQTFLRNLRNPSSRRLPTTPKFSSRLPLLRRLSPIRHPTCLTPRRHWPYRDRRHRTVRM